ncbi:MAG: tRNA preQ1(34) S-adenosylmethionine ribosyltransferase-isomerase QueA [Planctomycetes bacterium]|nr:tRNA preQ1(34) S-adenosylmethionine ribosyltransferase-isomerase QueA [Planctomycetota bacterium]
MSELDQYDYELPEELIAQHPLPTRSDARLLVVDRRSGALTHTHVRDLPEFLRPADSLVLNDTRVIPARLVGRRTATGGRWRGLFLAADERGDWLVLGKTRGKLQSGETVTLEDRDSRPQFTLTMAMKLEGGAWAARPSVAGEPFTLLEHVGRTPLPHYIRGGEMVDRDQETYQTVFAEKPGSVAAPTAGLHLTAELLAEIERRGAAIRRVTLHVGLGTFRPIESARLAEHRMHREWCSLDEPTADALREARQTGGRIVAVGTTTVRVLESAARDGALQPFRGETDLFIRPPYTFRAVDALMTNFHLPRSTLLVLVRTFGGDDLIRRAYEEAIRHRYRFYSYGDAMLIL